MHRRFVRKFERPSSPVISVESITTPSGDTHCAAAPTHKNRTSQPIWFSKIQRDVIARGIFTSISDLSTKLIRYIRQYNKTATPFRWRYQNADHRIKPTTQRASDSLH
jgi:hypothetical protein